MTTPDPSVSGWQVYQQLAQMSAKLDVLISQNADHEARLRMLEKGRWPQANLTMLISIVGVAAAILIAIFRH
jgi:hypothetical protein